MVDPEIETLIQKKSSIYKVDPDWVKAIITTESNWNQYALRYESNYQYLLNPEKFAKSNSISIGTEIAAQKMSWGFGQIMGALAREQGHKTSIAELLKPETNITHLCMRLNYLKANVSEEKDDVFACYNGGPGAMKKSSGSYINQVYVDRVNSNLSKLQV